MIFRSTQNTTTTINGYSNEEFMRLLGITIGSVDTNKLGEITYFTCCKLLSESVAKLPLKLYQDTDEGIKKATNHYLYNKLKIRPNPYMSAWNFWATVELNKNHYGNAYVYIDFDKKGEVVALYILPSENVKVWVDNAGIISKDNAIWYEYTDNRGKSYKCDHMSILHFKTAISLDGITGLSVQDCLKVSVENAQSGQKFINNYFKNGLFAKGILHYTGDLLEDNSVKKMQAKFETMANGIQNAGRILPVPLGFSFATINNSMSDSQFLELNKYTAQQIAAAFGIKPNQLNEQGKYNNQEMQQMAFYTDTLLSTLTQYEQELNYKLLTENEISQGYYWKFNVDAIIRADFKTRMDGYGVAVNNGVMTPNECRAKEELPAKTGGDRLIVNGNYVPLEDAGIQYKQKGGNQSDE